MNSVVIASNNKHKISELKALLSSNFELVYSLSELGIKCEPEETGTTFYENALIKAKAAAFLSNMPAIGDDSGLSVTALSGAPGIYSARYAGENANDSDNNSLLLKNLAGITDRRAEFVCSIVMHYPSGKIISGEARLLGEILDKPRGHSGFGYDPLFFIPELKKTMAELTPYEKNQISHRAKALLKFIKNLNAID